jgi:Putative prokaryotic signal transducing protein
VGSELVRVAVVPNEIEAEQIRAMLGLEGIDSMQRLTDYGAGSVDAGTSMAGAREILVRAKDLETARELIADG